MTDLASLLPWLQALCPDTSRQGDLLLALPEDRQTVRALVKAAIEEGCPVAAGAGPLSSGLRLDLSKLCDVSLDETSMVVRAGAGLSLGALDKALRDRGFTLGMLPGDMREHTVGGAISGRSYWRLGRFFAIFEDPLLALDAILPNGEIFSATPAPRRATGPDLVRLLAGSEGAYGLILSALLRVFPVPARPNGAAESFLAKGWRFPSFAGCARAARTLLAAGVSPSLLYAQEREAEAGLVSLWEGAPRGVLDARVKLARELLGEPSDNPAPLLAERSRPRESPPLPLAQGFLLYEKLEAFFQKLGPEHGVICSHVFLHEGVIFAVDGVDPEEFYDLILKEGGVPAPASPLYKLRDVIAARVQKDAAAPLRAVKRALDPGALFTPVAGS